ncbi:MAG: folate-binding protein [Pseudolabrys sp.]
MKAALLPDRGVIKVAGDDAQRFLNGIVTNDVTKLVPGHACFAALLTPQGKIIVDFLIVEASNEDGGGYFVDCPRALVPVLMERLKFYRLRAKVSIDDLSEALSLMSIWDGGAKDMMSDYGLSFADPRLAALGIRVMLPPEVAGEAAADLNADLVDADAYDAHRIALAVPRGGSDFSYGDTFPHEADMDQLAGVDFDKGCYIGQEVVSRVEHKSMARNRVVPVVYEQFGPLPGLPVTAGEKPVGMVGSSANGRGLALLRLDRVAEALAEGTPLSSGGIALRAVKPDWATFPWPGETKA